MNTLREKGINALKWDFVGRVSNHVISFLVTIILSRLLEPSDFGTIAIVMSAVGIATIFTDMGLATALIQRKRVLPIHYNSVFYFNISLGCLMALSFYFIASHVAIYYKIPQLGKIVEILSVLFPLSALASVQSTRLRKKLKHKIIAKVSVFSSLLSGIGGAIAAISGFGVWSLVLQIVLNSTIYSILLWRYGAWFPGLSFSLKALRQLWSFGFRMFLSGILEQIYSRMDYLLIGKLLDMSTLGYFQRAKSLNRLIVNYSSASLMSVLFPLLSQINKNTEKFQSVLHKTLLVLTFVVFLLIGLLYIDSTEIIILFFGMKWLASIEIFKLLSLTAYSYPISALLVAIIGSKGNSKAFLRLEIYKKIVASISFIILYLYGLTPFLYALIAQAFINTMILNIYFASKDAVVTQWFFYKPIIIQASIALISLSIVKFLFIQNSNLLLLNLVLKSISYLLIYLGINIIFSTDSYGIIKMELRNHLRKKFK